MQRYKTIDEFLNDLNDNIRIQIDLLRRVILEAEPLLEEHIKWNAPSYVWKGEDRITFNVMNKERKVKLVFHMGPTRKEDKSAPPIIEDKSKLIQWSSDIRGMITFNDMEDISEKHIQLKKIIKNWLLIPSGE
jgi:hypothetical protein